MKKVVILSEKAQFSQKKIQGLTLRGSSKFCRSDTLHLHMGRSGSQRAPADS